jgi:hypothetical protein
MIKYRELASACFIADRYSQLKCEGLFLIVLSQSLLVAINAHAERDYR